MASTTFSEFINADLHAQYQIAKKQFADFALLLNSKKLPSYIEKCMKIILVPISTCENNELIKKIDGVLLTLTDLQFFASEWKSKYLDNDLLSCMFS